MATPKQMRKLLELFEDTPTQQLQDVIPFLTILRDANVSEIDNEEFRKFCGLKKLKEDDDIIVRTTTVNRSRSPKQVLDATGRRQYTNSSVVESMPKGEGDEVEVVFFNLGCWISNDDLEKEYEKRELIPVDPYSLAAVNEADPNFTNEHPNGTRWKDSNNKWCSAAFSHWVEGRDVFVDRHDRAWDSYWWFAGLRK